MYSYFLAIHQLYILFINLKNGWTGDTVSEYYINCIKPRCSKAFRELCRGCITERAKKIFRGVGNKSSDLRTLVVLVITWSGSTLPDRKACKYSKENVRFWLCVFYRKVLGRLWAVSSTGRCNAILKQGEPSFEIMCLLILESIPINWVGA